MRQTKLARSPLVSVTAAYITLCSLVWLTDWLIDWLIDCVFNRSRQKKTRAANHNDELADRLADSPYSMAACASQCAAEQKRWFMAAHVHTHTHTHTHTDREIERQTDILVVRATLCADVGKMPSWTQAASVGITSSRWRVTAWYISTISFHRTGWYPLVFSRLLLYTYLYRTGARVCVIAIGWNAWQANELRFSQLTHFLLALSIPPIWLPGLILSYLASLYPLLWPI